MNNTDEAVTALGLGAMGSALAGAFVAAGHPTTVWNRTPQKAAALVSAGATWSDTAAAAIAASRLAVVSLGDHRSVHEVRDPVAGSRFVGEDPGLAPLHDLALLSGMCGMSGGAVQAFALVRSAGGSAQEFAPTLREWLGSMSGFVTGSAEQIDTGDYATGVVATLAMQASGYVHLVDVAEAQGVCTELLTPLAALIERRIAEGHGQDGIASVIEALVEPRAATGGTGGNR